MRGARLKALRQSLGLSRSQVAAVIPGWNWSDVMDLESGRRELAFWQTLLIARLFAETGIAPAVEEVFEATRLNIVPEEFRAA